MEAYFPNPLSHKVKVDEKKFMNVLLNIQQEISRFDSMLIYHPNKEKVINFLRAEEVISAASLELSSLNIDEYIEELLDKGNGADDLNEIRFMVDYYNDLTQKFIEEGFSISFFQGLQETLLGNRKIRRVTQNELYRRRQIWFYNAVQETGIFDMRLFAYPSVEKINPLLENLDYFIRNSILNPFITTAIAYGQLTMIHPWEYANGRVTGSLIPYLLNYLGLTRSHSFYLSSSFCKNKEDYFSQLVYLFKENDWERWITFFLKHVEDQVSKGLNKIEHIDRYCEEIKEVSLESRFSKETLYYIDILLKYPIFTVKEINDKYKFRPSAALPYIHKLIELGYLLKDNRKRNINYFFSEIITLISV